MATLPVNQVREHLREVLDRAVNADENTVITRNGEPIAAVVPIATLREWEAWEDERWADLVRARMAVSDGTGATLDEVIAQTQARTDRSA